MRFLPLLVAVLIAGCATRQLPVEPVGNDRVDVWDIKGRLAANIAGEGGSASFAWDKNHENHLIEIYGPLGSGRVILNQAGGTASLVDKDTEIRGEDLQDVLYQRTGWLVPFELLSDWITGRPGPEAFTSPHYDNSVLTGFTQSGWMVEYERFGDFSGTIMPEKLTLLATTDYLDELSRRLGRDVDRAQVKIIIKEMIR